MKNYHSRTIANLENELLAINRLKQKGHKTYQGVPIEKLNEAIVSEIVFIQKNSHLNSNDLQTKRLTAQYFILMMDYVPVVRTPLPSPQRPNKFVYVFLLIIGLLAMIGALSSCQKNDPLPVKQIPLAFTQSKAGHVWVQIPQDTLFQLFFNPDSLIQTSSVLRMNQNVKVRVSTNDWSKVTLNGVQLIQENTIVTLDSAVVQCQPSTQATFIQLNY